MEKQVFPEFKIIDPKEILRNVVGRIQGFLALGRTTELCLSGHIQEPTQPELPLPEMYEVEIPPFCKDCGLVHCEC